jgi:hypothetical protein
VKEQRARGEDGLTVTAMIGVAATDGEDEALTDALDGASTVQNKSVEEMRLVRG